MPRPLFAIAFDKIARAKAEMRRLDASLEAGTSHQALLDQMHVAIDGRRPALLDDELYA